MSNETPRCTIKYDELLGCGSVTSENSISHASRIVDCPIVRLPAYLQLRHGYQSVAER